MRKHIIAAALSTALSWPAHGSGIPVIDSAGLAQAVAQVNHLLTQIETLRQQLAQAQALYASVTGIRNLGDVLSNPLVREAMPADLQGALQGIESAGQVWERTQAILENQQLPESLDDAEAFLRERQSELAAAQQALAEGSYAEADNRLNRLDGLLREVNRSSDLQMTVQIQARLNTEQATIAAENHRLLAALAANQAAERLVNQQQIEATRRAFAGDGTPQPSILENWSTWRNAQ